MIEPMAAASRASQPAFEGSALPSRFAIAVLSVIQRPVVIGTVWFVVSLTAVLWTWGLDPETFSSPDESVNRLAAGLVRESGRPFLTLPHEDDEDLVHPRFWVSMGEHAVPAYPPVSYFLFAFALSVPLAGGIAMAALPASGLAVFAAGSARLMTQRPWLAWVAPLAAFPALYWMLRPWMNISLLLVFLCWSFYYWVRWRDSRNVGALAASFLFIGTAAAVRPDFALFLLAATCLFSLAQDPGQWRRIVVCAVTAGAGAIVVNLVLNAITTGDPLLAGYQIHADRQDEGQGQPSGPFSSIYLLVLPWGLPGFREAMGYIQKYWFEMGPIAILLAGQLALLPLTASATPGKRILWALAALTLVVFMVSRMSDSLYGADEQRALLRHSIPRYWSPVYLLAAIPPLVFLSRCRNDLVVGVMVTMLVALAFTGARDVYSRQPESLTYLHDLRLRNEQSLDVLEVTIPPNALLYTVTEDKTLSSRWSVALLRGPAATASSMSKGVDLGLDVFVVQSGIREETTVALGDALADLGYRLDMVDGQRGIYRVTTASAVRLSSTQSP